MTSHDDQEPSANHHVRAATGAFLYVAFADAAFDPSEEARLLVGLLGRTPFSDFEAKQIEREYNSLVAALKEDFPAAAATILEAVRSAASDPAAANAVALGARAAIVADGRVTPQEEAALAQICAALGREPGSL